MQLTLKNFRCYTNKTFNFEDDTITLISGSSGCGKTTILLAIQFALYGSVNQKFLVSHNKNSCEVTLIYKNFKVKRTKRPNILNIEKDGKFYEDKEAQIILNKYFGITNSSIFFIDLPHLEKMEFLEKIVNGDCDVKELKNKIKIEISTLNKNLAILEGQISNTESMLKIIQKPNKVEKPLINDFFNINTPLEFKQLTKEQLILKKEETIKKLKLLNLSKTKYDQLMIEYDLINKEINSLGNLNHQIHKEQVDNINHKLKKLKLENDNLNKIKTKMFMVEESLKELEKYKDVNDDSLLKLNQEIKLLDEKIDTCIKYKEVQDFKKLQNEYNSLLNLERDEWKNKIEILNNQLHQINMDDLNPEINLEQILLKLKTVKTFNSKYNINEINDQINTLKLKFFKNYKCSNCNHNLTINMDTFEMVQLDQDLFDLILNDATKPVNTIKLELNKLENLKLKLEANERFIKSEDEHVLMEKITLEKKFKELSLELKKLDSFKPSISLVKIEKKINKLKEDLTIDLSNIEQIYDKEEVDKLKDKKRDLIISKNDLSQKIKIKNNLLNKIQIKETYDPHEHQKILDSIECCKEAINTFNIEFEKFKTQQRLNLRLEAINNEIQQLNYNTDDFINLEDILKNIESGLEYHENFEKYKLFQIQLSKYKKVKDTLKNFVENKKQKEQIYLKTLLFKQKVIESEQESLQVIINIINTHLSILLEDFFSESFGDPIQIYLELTNDKKPQVDTIINYKGNKVDCKSLSTGEYARVKLAFDLTFKEILGESIIMLDECTANLDEDLSTKIFTKIKKTFPSKTILVVAHQVILGEFDHILKL